MASTRSARATKAAPVKKVAAAKKTAAKKAAPPAKRAPARKAAAKKVPPAKKAAAKKAPAKKAAPARRRLRPGRRAAKKAAREEGARPRRLLPRPRRRRRRPRRRPAKKAPAKKASSEAPVAVLGRSSSASSTPALIEERATYLGQAETLQAEAESLVADIDPGDVQFDEESGEGDTLAIERDRDWPCRPRPGRRSRRSTTPCPSSTSAPTASARCRVTRSPKERLEAIPWARERVEYKVGGLGRR